MVRNALKGSARLLPLFALAGLCASCGGGGNSGGFDDGADVSGIWSGTVNVDGGAQNVHATLIVRPNGTVYLDTPLALLIGEAETDDNAFSAETDGYAYEDDFADGSDFSLSGTVTAGTAITGAISGAGISGTFTFARDADLSALPASLPDLADTYDSNLWVGGSSSGVNVTIAANGDLTGSDGDGCTLDGSVTVLESTGNIYKWQADLSGCAANGSASGIGFVQDDGGIYFVGKVAGGAIYLAGGGEASLTSIRLPRAQ